MNLKPAWGQLLVSPPYLEPCGQLDMQVKDQEKGWDWSLRLRSHPSAGAGGLDSISLIECVEQEDCWNAEGMLESVD